MVGFAKAGATDAQLIIKIHSDIFNGAIDFGVGFYISCEGRNKHPVTNRPPYMEQSINFAMKHLNISIKQLVRDPCFTKFEVYLPYEHHIKDPGLNEYGSGLDIKTLSGRMLLIDNSPWAEVIKRQLVFYEVEAKIINPMGDEETWASYENELLTAPYIVVFESVIRSERVQEILKKRQLDVDVFTAAALAAEPISLEQLHGMNVFYAEFGLFTAERFLTLWIQRSKARSKAFSIGGKDLPKGSKVVLAIELEDFRNTLVREFTKFGHSTICLADWRALQNFLTPILEEDPMAERFSLLMIGKGFGQPVDSQVISQYVSAALAAAGPDSFRVVAVEQRLRQ